MKKIELPPRGLETLFGVHDQNIKYLESLLDVRIDVRGQDVSIDGDPKDVGTAECILEDFSELFKEGRQFTDKELREAFAQLCELLCRSTQLPAQAFCPVGQTHWPLTQLVPVGYVGQLSGGERLSDIDGDGAEREQQQLETLG